MPDWKSEIERFLAPLHLQPEREAAVAEELAQHLDDRYQEMLAEGATAAEARRILASELSAGAPQWRGLLHRDRPAEVPGTPGFGARPMRGIWADFRYAARQLRLSPGYAVIAVLSLALGVGANTAIFQLLDAVRLRTLPVENPQQLADVKFVYAPNGRTGNFHGAFSNLTTAQWELIRKQQQGFSSLAAWGAASVNLNSSGEARYVPALYVSGNFFDTLGVHAAAGRLLAAEDDQKGCGAGAAVISYSFWQREFGGQASVIGRTLTLAGNAFQIAGVTEAGFSGVQVGRTFDIALPLCAEPLIDGENETYGDAEGWWLSAMGRLQPGWTVQRASAQLATISAGILESTVPPRYDAVTRKDYLNMRLGAVPAAHGVSELRREYDTPLWLLMAIAGVVLLIACANLANLMLARAAARQREMAVRLALGASRARLIRQMLAESLLIAVLGAAAGALLAQALSRGLVALLSTQDGGRRLFVNLAIDWRVLAFTAALAVLTCLLFGLTPALQASRIAPGEAMKASSRTATAGPRRFGLRRALVVSQVALSLVLVVTAVLFVRTFTNLLHLDAGFREDHLLVADIDYSRLKLPKQRRIPYKLELLRQIRAIPGVASAATAQGIPLSGNRWNRDFEIPGSNRRGISDINQVTSGYFQTLGTAMLAGRDFNEGDNGASPRVVIVNQAFASKYLGAANPIGRTIKLLRGSLPAYEYQIIGVVQNTKYLDLRQNFQPIVYLAEAQSDEPDMEAQIFIHSDLGMESLTAAVKTVVTQASPDAEIIFRNFHTMVRDGLVRERLMAILSGFFGGLAALLAMIGLYGVISYMVTRRRNEIGIRMALGAARGSIVAMVMREAGVLLIAGLVIGGVLSLCSARAASTLLFGLTPRDPAALLTAAAGLSAVAVVASFLPARRAAALDPLVALRDE